MKSFDDFMSEVCGVLSGEEEEPTKSIIGTLRIGNGKLYIDNKRIGRIDDDLTWNSLVAYISKRELLK